LLAPPPCSPSPPPPRPRRPSCRPAPASRPPRRCSAPPSSAPNRTRRCRSGAKCCEGSRPRPPRSTPARDAEACPSRGAAAWAALLRGVAGEPRLRQVREINRFINGWEYRTDADNYGRSDYWATPFEFFRRSGDFENYAIAKYRSLRLLGWPADRLRMVVVQDVIRDLPHAVLAVYLEDEVYILDNLTDAVLPQARVGHYVPYYSVNEVTRWAHTPTDALVVTSSRAAVEPVRPARR
jgi:predicted transglutaminase-like cysteine proteinase